MLAFGIARLVGYRVVRRWFGDGLKFRLLGSQNTMTTIVLVSRLIPFLSFDLVSYGAGLTPLKTWRFALATLAGILPASFLLAHFGGEMASAEPSRIGLTVLALGAMTGIPIVVGWVRRRRAAGKAEDEVR